MIPGYEFLSIKDLIKGERIGYLIGCYLQQNLSSQEQDELETWIVESDHNLMLFEELTSEENLIKMIKEYFEINTAESLERVKRRIGFTND
jgi:transmembrane sensor